MNSLMIAGLHKAYQGIPVLKGISLLAPNATLTAVLGASGSGKTTLLRVIAGFERAGQGVIKLGDLTVEGPDSFLPPELRRIGYVSQDGSLFPHLSVRDNVGFGLARKERRGRRIDELLELVGLSGLGHRPSHQLSGGEQQRVSLARALAPGPRLLLMDEPFSALDAGLRASLRTDVRTVLRETGVTAILVTHDQDEALSLADQVAVLRDGMLIQSGPPKHLYETPVDRDLAQFVGDANFIDGTLEQGRVRTEFGLFSLANASPSAKDGVPITVMLRPEQIQVTGREDPQGHPAVIERCEYFGHDAVMSVRPLQAPSAGRLILRVLGHDTLPPGEKVWLKFPDAALSFPGVGPDLAAAVIIGDG